MPGKTQRAVKWLLGCAVASATASASAQIVPSDDAYVVDQAIELIASGAAGNPPGVAANDQGLDGSVSFACKVLEPPSHGELFLQGNGNFRYVPQPNFHGTDQFIYCVALPDTSTTLIDSSQQWRYLNPQNGRNPTVDDPDFDQTWFTPLYIDNSWAIGSGLMGYGTLGDVQPDTDIRRPTSGERKTAYFRTTFSIDQSLRGTIKMRIKRDDAAIIYLDGTEIARSHESGALLVARMPDDYLLYVEPDSSAWTDGDEETAIRTITIPNVSLESGEHLIAVSVHNTLNGSGAFSSSDLGFEMVSLSLEPEPTAGVEITVAEQSLTPVIEADAYLVAGDREFSSLGAWGRSPLENDGLLNAGGMPFGADLAVTVLNPSNEGTLTQVDPSNGHFSYQPVDGFRGVVRLNYQVTVTGMASAPAPILLVVVDPADLPPPLMTAVAGTPVWFEWELPTDLLFSTAKPPLNGELAWETLNRPPLRYTPDEGFNGEDCATALVTSDVGSGELLLRLSSLTPHQAWLSTSFDPQDLDNDAVSGFAADPDGDQFSNIEEYVFGTDPARPDGFGESRLSLGGIPANLQSQFSLPDIIPEDVIVEFQLSTDLSPGSWETRSTRYPGESNWVGPTGLTSSSDPSLPPAQGRVGFYRLRYSILPN